MFGSRELFKISGIPIKADLTIVFVALIVGGGMAGAAALVLTILIHELGHAFAARRFGAHVSHINLGFVSSANYMLPGGGISPTQQAFIAFAGPLVNFIQAAIFWGAGRS